MAQPLPLRTRSLSWAGRALVCLGTLACGCSDSGEPEPASPAATGGAPRDAAQKSAAQQQNVPAEARAFSYSPVGRRDPFRSYLTQVQERRDAQVRDHRHEATEDFDVAQFRLVGLITGTSQPKAMVDDPNGEAHVLHVGSRIGKNGGRVVSIGPRGLTVQEDTVDASGHALSVPITVRLPEDVLDLVPAEP